jgi:hypothetical protein
MPNDFLKRGFNSNPFTFQGFGMGGKAQNPNQALTQYPNQQQRRQNPLIPGSAPRSQMRGWNPYNQNLQQSSFNSQPPAQGMPQMQQIQQNPQAQQLMQNPQVQEFMKMLSSLWGQNQR